MASVADLVGAATVEKLARPADIRLGREIARQGGVELIEFGPLLVRAKVGGVGASPTKRTVVLESSAGALQWSCTCTKKPNRFCKHCVAAAQVAWDRAPKRR